MERNFGMPHPEGYRKAIRVAELAEKYGMPVLTFIDTPWAYPGIGAEERGQSRAIAQSLYIFGLKSILAERSVWVFRRRRQKGLQAL